MSHIHDHLSAERLQAFLDGGLPERDRRRIGEHVETCARCAEALASWQHLFEDLGGLEQHSPRVGFADRVMAGVAVPEPLPLAARVRARLVALFPRPRPEHPAGSILQDFADGVLGPRAMARVQAHLEGCPACADEARSWAAVLARLSQLERFTPEAGFADEVMVRLEPSAGMAPAPLPTRRPAWAPLLAYARRVVPRTRRAWAALAGAAVTPAVTFGLLIYAVFSHPTLTPQALVSFAFWQLSDLLVAGWSTLLAGSLSAARLAGLDGLVQTLIDQPLLVATGLAIYGFSLVLALRILYKNLVDRRSVRPGYAAAS